jgi:hypothetical protein
MTRQEGEMRRRLSVDVENVTDVRRQRRFPVVALVTTS